ncbi:hypothetical protein [Nesterenkonia sp.]|uniref:hypothetical protein n=1 Tax=Nesterenkonia sp. TaxID=704201 RepID=UPI0026296F2F|nr:hypothetical protein [Nesterenkonia sp.]
MANSALEQFVNALYEFALWILEIISTWWMNTPNADVESAAVTQIQQDIQWYVMGFAMIGFLMGLIRMVSSQDIRQGLTTSFKPIVNLILVTGVYAAAVTMLLRAGDEGSMWLLSRATDGEADLSTMFMPASAGGGAAALIPMLLVYLLAGVGGIVNFVFMIFRNILLVVLMAFLPALAAATGTQRGDQAFAKANGWLLALLLFKPVAAGIYALGFRFMRSDTDMGLDDELATAVDQLTGAGIILLAALALPALIKFLVPAAAIGAGAFTGGAAIGAGVGVAAGAAVLASTGGAGAAAAGGAATSGASAGSSGLGSVGSAAASGGSGGPGGGSAAAGGADASSGGSNAAVPSGSNAGSGAASGSGGGTGSSSTGPGHSGSASGVAGSGSNQTSSSGSSADGGGAAPVGGGAAAAPAGHSASASPEGASGSTAGSSSTAAAGGGAASSGASTPGAATAGGSQGSSGANAGDAVRAADAGRGIAAEGSSDDGADDEEGGRP